MEDSLRIKVLWKHHTMGHNNWSDKTDFHNDSETSTQNVLFQLLNWWEKISQAGIAEAPVYIRFQFVVSY